MKIAVNSRIYQQAGSGIPYYIKNLYSKLQQLDKRNSYIFFQTDDSKVLGKTEVVKSKQSGFAGAFFDLFSVNKLIRKQPVDIFHGSSFMLPFFRRRKVKYIVTIHDLAFLTLRHEPNDYSLFYYLFTKYGIKRSLTVANIVVTDSKSTKRDVIKYYHTNPQKIKVVHLGINEDIARAKKLKNRLIKEKYFFSISTNLKRKNTINVLKAMSKSSKLNHLIFVVAGLLTKQQQQELNQVIKNLKLKKRVKVFGYATGSELKNLYQNAEFFIYPSFYEGFGFPVVEAMFCNCPVITSNASSLPELIPDKKWLVDPYDILDIVAKMEQIVSLGAKERSRLITKNNHFCKRFTWDKTAEKMLKIFSQLAK